MNMNDIIIKKRNGGKLSDREIEGFISGYVDGSIPDYQAAALLMAIYFRGLDREETFQLTNAMRFSGDTIDLSKVDGVKVDKHSTGGVGDKTTLIVAPLAAASGVPIAKMSGRGLGFTGGTVDKMEAIPGFKTALEPEDFFSQVNRVGMAVIGQTAHITPADKKLYALRDVTGTVDNYSLIASSIMSKKLAAGSDAIVLDVKCGEGAFMKDIKNAEVLGNIMVDIGDNAGKKTVAIITDMSQPLGKAVGNSLEVIEAIETLKGKGPKDIMLLSLKLAGMMIYLGGKSRTWEHGCEMAEEALTSGKGLDKLQEFIVAQGGNGKVIDDYSLFPKHTIEERLYAEKTGYVTKIHAETIGIASQHTGAGRTVKDEGIDLSAGIYLNKKIGEKVEKGQMLATLYGNDIIKVQNGLEVARGAFVIDDVSPQEPVLVKSVIGL